MRQSVALLRQMAGFWGFWDANKWNKGFKVCLLIGEKFMVEVVKKQSKW